MAKELISAASSSGRQLDSLSANEFVVELDGQSLTGIFRISGLIPFKLDVKPAMTKLVRDPLKLVKMVQREPQNAINQWLQETVDAKEDFVRPKRTFAIVALDDGVETRRWVISNAWVAEISYSEFNTASSDLIEETITLHYEDIEVHFMG
jgi:T4-like virus tail tube protein gp19